MNEGKKFEEDFKKSMDKYNIWNYRLRDSSGSWSNSNGSRFTPKNICDYIAYSNGELYLLELKSHKGTSLPYTAISDYQLKGLSNIDYPGIKAYFIINMRDKEKTYAIEAQKIKKYIETSERKSIPISFMDDEGVEIKGIKRRTRFEYDVGELLCGYMIQ